MKEKFPAKNTENSLEKEINYCNSLLSVVKNYEELTHYPTVSQSINLLEEILQDDVEHLHISEDNDAKIGHKTSDTSFFGYKTHLAMTEERIITAATITTGEKNQINLVAKLNSGITQGFRKKEDEFQFNKDAGMYVCKACHMAIRKARQGKKNTSCNQVNTYYFDVEKCKVCPFKEGCYKEGAKTKTYSTIIRSNVHKNQINFQESDYFKEKSKERYKIETKNSELKHRHGYDVASSSGLIGMNLQGAVAIFAVNIKIILKLIDEK